MICTCILLRTVIFLPVIWAASYSGLSHPVRINFCQIYNCLSKHMRSNDHLPSVDLDAARLPFFEDHAWYLLLPRFRLTLSVSKVVEVDRSVDGFS